MLMGVGILRGILMEIDGIKEWCFHKNVSSIEKS